MLKFFTYYNNLNLLSKYADLIYSIGNSPTYKHNRWILNYYYKNNYYFLKAIFSIVYSYDFILII